MTVQAKIKRQTITASVLELIRSRIIDGVYAGGQQIRQEAIAAELGVSRIPIREALVQLENEGLLQIHTHRGAIVSVLSVADATEIFDARLVLEPAVLEKAAGRAVETDILAVHAALSEYEAGLAARVQPERMSSLNWAFHVALLRPSLRTRSIDLLSSLYKSADRYLRLQIDGSRARRNALGDHRKIARAFRARDAALASSLLATHISNAKTDVIAALSQAGPTAGQK